MKLTVSTRERIEFIPEVVDKKATEAARKAAPAEERDDVDEIMVPADYSLYFWPLTLKEEEAATDEIQAAPATRTGGGVRLSVGIANRMVASHMCGWKGMTSDDNSPFGFDPEWERKVPDDVVQALGMAVCQSAYVFLMQQASGTDEMTVGKPE